MPRIIYPKINVTFTSRFTYSVIVAKKKKKEEIEKKDYNSQIGLVTVHLGTDYFS